MSKENAAGAAPQENKMGVLPVGRLLAGMAVPMMISMLVQALYNIVDSVFVSRLSENAFNAVGLAFKVVFVGNAHKYFMLPQILIAKRLAIWR